MLREEQVKQLYDTLSEQAWFADWSWDGDSRIEGLKKTGYIMEVIRQDAQNSREDKCKYCSDRQ
ncbi:MAG: hypothetical protein WBZ36_12890 [Candidatus Nitrosopolaris sp.]